jgi:hypothetical protein
MHHFLLNRVIATLMMGALLCLQGCRSRFQVTSEDAVLKELCRTSDGAQLTDQVAVPDVRSSASGGGLPTAASTTLSPAVAPMVQVDSPASYLSAEPNTGLSWQQALSTEFEETDAEPASGQIAQVVGSSPAGCLASLRALSIQVPTVFGSRDWRRYFGEVGEEPPLPAYMDEILRSPCPFWPDKAVQDTHLLVLVPSTVDGEAFNLDLLRRLVQHPRGGGHSTQYFLYDSEVQRSLGDAYPSSPYWILLTRDVLPGSRNKPYTAQQALVAARTYDIACPSYEIPRVLEVATAILSHYVRSGERLYEGGGDALPSTSTCCAEVLGDATGQQSPATVGRFCAGGLVFLTGFDNDVESGISGLRQFGIRNYRPSSLLHSFGAEEWSRYFGEVGEVPWLPWHVVDTLNYPCPFWPGKLIKDTHLLVLIPATVAGRPFNLNLLGGLIQRPQGGSSPTKYRRYSNKIQAEFGTQSPIRSYWVLMTRDVLEGSKGKKYAAQQALVAHHAGRTGLPYELPGALEAATVILSHYIHRGNRLYADMPWTYTRCQDLVGHRYPVVVGGFSSEGLDIAVRSFNFHSHHGFDGVLAIWRL